MVEGERIAAWLGRLVQIPSVSSAQAGPRAGTPGEARIAGEVARWFRELGGEASVEEVVPGRPNVYGTWRGRSDRWLAVDTHLDTVSVEQMAGDPFSGHVEAGRVYGRGAVDTKATLAVVLALLEAMRARGITPAANLLLAGTIDEEVEARGAPAFAQWIRGQGIRIDEMAVAEPTRCAPICAHKGVLRLRFRITGTASHSAQPHLGKNAISAAARLVLALEAEHQRLQAAPAETDPGPPVLTVTMIEGGRGMNVVPDACTLAVDRRLAPGERGAEVAGRLIELVSGACPLPVAAEVVKQIDAFHQPTGDPWVRSLVQWSGQSASVAPFCTNAWAYAGLARACVVIGPGSIDQAHGDVEWVALTELEKLAGIYARWWGLQE